MNSKETVIVARYRPTDYIVNYTGNDGNKKRYVWSGSKKDRVDKKPIPKYIIDDLTMTSNCFNDGELVIIDEKDKKSITEGIDDVEKYENNTNSKEDIVKTLNKSITQMKKDLKKITVNSEKQFVIQVAKEIELDSKGKLKFLAEWIGVKEELLFD